MTLGIGSYTFGWATGAYGFSDPNAPRLEHPMTATDIVDKAVELGAACAQICYRPALHKLSADELSALARHAQRHGVCLEIGTSGFDPGLLERYAQIAAALEARLVRTIVPGASPGFAEERRVVERLLPFYERSGVILAIENHEDCSSADLAALVADVGSPSLGVCLDSVNSLGRGEGTREVVTTLAPCTASLHVKDFATRRRPSGMGFEVTGAPLGEGRLDIDWLVRTVGAVRPEASVILEQWSDFAGDLDTSIAEQERTARIGLGRLRSTLERTGMA
ncbi:MAG: sugar phosphate isomerase/epimerase family protein [Spirochaetota bacterium]